MTKKDIEQLSVIYERLSLGESLSEGLLNELDQSTMNNAVMKHQDIRDRNRVARTRSDKFNIKHDIRSHKDGTSIQAENANGDNYVYYIHNAQKLSDNDIMINALRRPIQIDSKFEKAVLAYHITNSTLSDSGIMPDAPAGSEKNVLQLLGREDAINLAKSIKQYTGITIPWKSIRFKY